MRAIVVILQVSRVDARVVSSAYITMSIFSVAEERSLIKILNKRGVNTNPCKIPHEIWRCWLQPTGVKNDVQSLSKPFVNEKSIRNGMVIVYLT